MTRVAGAPAELVQFDREFLEMISEVPLAPGTPTAIEVENMALQGKSQGSKRLDDGRYRVRFRLINLRREHRERLKALCREATTPQGV